MVAQHPATSIPPAGAAAHGEFVRSAEAMKGCTIQTDSTNRRTELAADFTMPLPPSRSTFTPEQSGGDAR